MPLAKRLVIFALAEGLILQNASQGNFVDAPQALRIEWKTGKLTPWRNTALEKIMDGAHVETHGVVGLLNVASNSFLITITRREQVAQILGKPIYVIKDISLLPLSSKIEAEKALQQPRARADKDVGSESETDLSDTESLNDDNLDDQLDGVSDPRTPEKTSHLRKPSTIAQDVINRRGQYAKVASQWFTKSGWNQSKQKAQETTAESADEAASSGEKHLNEDVPMGNSATDAPPSPEEIKEQKSVEGPPSTSFPLMPRLLKATRALLGSTSFYFSYDVDITRSLGSPNSTWSQPPSKDTTNPLYFWNRQLADPFYDSGFPNFIVPIMQGFVGQKAFLAKQSQNGNEKTQAVESLQKILEADEKYRQEAKSSSEESADLPPQPFLLTVISRRSIKRSGLRYLRRGIDDEGNTANTAETEQILSSPSWDDTVPIRSFLQIRGSIPLYFSQSPYSLKPWPMMHRSQETNEAAFKKHFQSLISKYGKIKISMLVDKHGTEAAIGEAYEAYANRYNDANSDKISFDWFDFHAECRGMKFENVRLLVDQMQETLDAYGETVIKDKKVVQNQTGIIRTNCMDCLDRTNVVESAYAQYMLEKDMRQEGFEIDFKQDPSTLWFGALWSDNGDNISREYAGTAALKGDFTRTRKRTYRGALGDFSLTLGRYYSNIVNDYFAQTVIDYLLGTVTMSAFEDFEADMKNADPGVNLEAIRQKAIDTCTKMVIHDDHEDLIGGWTVLSPKMPNTLRSVPFEESVLLLTDMAIYRVKFDWNTEKVGSFERIDLKSITGMRYGAYITSTLTQRQLDETQNLGILVTYNPGKDSVIRVNTRSLQNSVNPAKDELPTDQIAEDKKPQGSGKNTEQTHVMAVKMIPAKLTSQKPLAEALKAQTEQVAEEIQRAARNASVEPYDAANQITMEQAPVISSAEAKKNTGVLEYVGHQVKKLVWG